MKQKMKDALQKMLLYLFGVASVLGLIVGIIWAIWHFGMQRVTPNVARAWALVATAMLPITALFFWWFGHTEARGRLAGIDDAVDKVAGAAIKLGAASKQATAPQPQPERWVLPQRVEILEPRRLPQEDVIDL